MATVKQFEDLNVWQGASFLRIVAVNQRALVGSSGARGGPSRTGHAPYRRGANSEFN